MQRFKFSILTLSIFCLSFSACKKDINYHTEWNKPLPETESLSGKINEIQFESTLITAQLYTTTPNLTMQIMGMKNASGFSLMLNNYHGAGDYAIEKDEAICSFIDVPTDPYNAAYMGESGTVKVISVTDKNIKGTFQFIGTSFGGSSKTITEGKFSVNYMKF
ncbi:DUF6252 family protein [Pedobacter nototheniae]|uniref:DUF6252 family protein n=1 Tax=Pedobacter nototheniae TaxID=2488994 RepID=UPI002930362D|nr:DUF6252 family protein [Pedobacter nototheniae]